MWKKEKNFGNVGTFWTPRLTTDRIILFVNNPWIHILSWFSSADEPVVLPTIIVGTLVIVFGIPFFSVANVSLYSKITEERTQGKRCIIHSVKLCFLALASA